MARVEIVSNYKKLVNAFEAAPAKTRDFVALQVKMATRDIRERARNKHVFKSRTGITEREGIAIGTQGSRGEVWLASAVAIYQHEGTRAHDIEPRNKKALRFVMGGEFVFAKRAHVAGIKADHYLYNAADYCLPAIRDRFSAGLDELIRGL